MITSNNIICPDCGEEYISERRFNKYHRCVKCERRYKIAIKNNKDYVPISDLSKSERKTILNKRKSATNRVNNKLIKTQTRTNKNKTNESKTTKKRSSIYTKEILSKCVELKNKGLLYKDIVKELQKDGINATKSGLISAIWRYKQGKQSKEVINEHSDIEDMYVPNDEVILDAEVTSIDYNKTEKDDTDVISNDKVDDSTDDINTQSNSSSDLKTEVDNVAMKKFMALGCNESEQYNTDDYINMLDMLEYLVVNQQQILEHRQSQHDIMNAYQDDVLHEIEAVDPDDGDNTLQKKLHIVRNKRRYYEWDYNDVGIMKQFLESVDLRKLKIVLGQLRKFKQVRNRPVFIPSVDKQMINKYNWAIKSQQEPNIKTMKITSTISIIHALETNGLSDSNLQSNELPNKFKQTFVEPHKFFNIPGVQGVSKYRASCKLSGSGFGAFKTWYKDYICLNEEVAESYFKKDLERLKQKHKGILITETQINKINI